MHVLLSKSAIPYPSF